MTDQEKMRMQENNLYLQAKKIEKLKNDIKELQKQLREKDNIIRDKVKTINFYKSAYNRMKGDS